ncbi:MAG: hypothetical protein KA191_03840 [Verrucomicrobia bacterium]|jgi:hypothetical protein|nr:hypothetical protein [Verrucomicrobiota bacterium]OQC67436.1 MAG: hypothetical protein BWX48_00801 [Verrucomicrobia bacterium ADurb.Bin006]MDI9380153.1 hypothetical protein [Verrucomicrobiota bacterium]NMD21367.1 hypothetical protein [Verrucomicrobiota bacterium]HNU99570.1 hypothetical protein [Verrucomicrobiota bacterium]
MKTFESRWQELTRHARAARVERPEAAAFGFARRVTVRAASANGTTEDLWMRFCIRSLIGVSGVLVVLGAMEYSSARPASLMNPGVENTVAQLLGVL